jgi:hypothetical protein
MRGRRCHCAAVEGMVKVGECLRVGAYHGKVQTTRRQQLPQCIMSSLPWTRSESTPEYVSAAEGSIATMHPGGMICSWLQCKISLQTFVDAPALCGQQR